MSTINHDTAQVWQGWQQRELRITHCQSCGAWISLPTPFCPECWSDDIVAEEVGGKARLVTFSVPRAAPEAEPVVTGVVTFEEAPGLRMMARIVGCPPAEIHAGMALEVDWRDDDGSVLPQFRVTSEVLA